MTPRSPHDNENSQVFVLGSMLWLTSRSNGARFIGVLRYRPWARCRREKLYRDGRALVHFSEYIIEQTMRLRGKGNDPVVLTVHVRVRMSLWRRTKLCTQPRVSDGYIHVVYW